MALNIDGNTWVVVSQEFMLLAFISSHSRLTFGRFRPYIDQCKHQIDVREDLPELQHHSRSHVKGGGKEDRPVQEAT